MAKEVVFLLFFRVNYHKTMHLECGVKDADTDIFVGEV